MGSSTTTLESFYLLVDKMRLVDNISKVVLWGGIFAISSIFSKGALFLFTLYLSKILPAPTYAAYGLLYAIMVAAATFSIIGVNELTAASIKSYARGANEKKLFERMLGLFILLAFVVSVLISVTAIIFLDYEGISLYGVISAVLLGLVNAYANMKTFFLRLNQKYFFSLILHTGIPAISIFGMFAFSYVKQDVSILFIGGLLFALIFLLLVMRLGLASNSRFNFNIQSQKLLGKALPYGGIALIGWLSGYGMTLYIALVNEVFVVALYTLLYTVASMAQLIASSANMARVPVFYRLYNNDSVVEANLFNRRILSYLSLLLGFLGALVVAVWPFLAEFIGGNATDYSDYQIELAWLFAGYVASIPWWSFQNYYYVSDKGSELVRVVFWSGGVGLIVWATLIYKFGVSGVFFGFFIKNCIQSLFIYFSGRKLWRVNVPWLSMSAGLTLVFVGCL